MESPFLHSRYMHILVREHIAHHAGKPPQKRNEERCIFCALHFQPLAVNLLLLPAATSFIALRSPRRVSAALFFDHDLIAFGSESNAQPRVLEFSKCTPHTPVHKVPHVPFPQPTRSHTC